MGQSSIPICHETRTGGLLCARPCAQLWESSGNLRRLELGLLKKNQICPDQTTKSWPGPGCPLCHPAGLDSHDCHALTPSQAHVLSSLQVSGEPGTVTSNYSPTPGGERAVLAQVAGLGRRQWGQEGRGPGRLFGSSEAS